MENLKGKDEFMKKLRYTPDLQLFAGETAQAEMGESGEGPAETEQKGVESGNENTVSDFTEKPAEQSERVTDTQRVSSLRSRIGEWLRQSEDVKNTYPDFDLRKELRQSKLFGQLLLGGAPLKAVYETVHKDEIISGAMAYTADKVREQVVRGIEAKGRRPLENGVSSEGAVVTSVDVNSLTSQDILKILKQVENGASISF